MSKPAGRPLITMRQALEDPKVFGKILEGSSWTPWRAGLIESRGEKILKPEQPLIEPLTGRTTFPTKPVRRFTCCVGRRGGKTRAMAVYAAYLAAAAAPLLVGRPCQRADRAESADHAPDPASGGNEPRQRCSRPSFPRNRPMNGN